MSGKGRSCAPGIVIGSSRAIFGLYHGADVVSEIVKEQTPFSTSVSAARLSERAHADRRTETGSCLFLSKMNKDQLH